MDLGSYASGIHKIVINGNDHTISGLNNPLIGYCYFGGVEIEINDLTISNANMSQATSNDLGYGAFVLSADNVASIVLNNCHLKDSTIKAKGDKDSVGGLVGFSSTSVINITNCSVNNCSISGETNAGGLIGNCYHEVNLTNCEINNTDIYSSKASSYRIGYAIGTVQTGSTVQISNVTFDNNGSISQPSNNGPHEDTICTQLIGRNLGNVTGDNSTPISF